MGCPTTIGRRTDGLSLVEGSTVTNYKINVTVISFRFDQWNLLGGYV